MRKSSYWAKTFSSSILNLFPRDWAEIQSAVALGLSNSRKKTNQNPIKQPTSWNPPKQANSFINDRPVFRSHI